MEQNWNGIERRAQNRVEQHPAEARLREVQACMNALLDNTPYLMWLKDSEGRFVAANRALVRYAGKQHASEVIGMTDFDLCPKELAQRYRVEDSEVMATRSGKLIEAEENHLGQLHWMETYKTPIVDANGKLLGTAGFARDLSEHKERERQRLADLEKQREVLVREVHHRIKNNLQSVAGLLRRELGRFAELDPHLDKAITQVHAIAVVHGLQSADPDEAIRLCDTVSHICTTVREQTLRPIEFRIENEHTSFRPVQINRDEAVAVALILNELILNAVKHSPEQAAAPQVSLAADGERAHIVIRNALTGTGEGITNGDLETSANLKTGLRLVKSLLPEQGAHLAYALDADGLLTTHLRLEALVVQAISHKGA